MKKTPTSGKFEGYLKKQIQSKNLLAAVNNKVM